MVVRIIVVRVDPEGRWVDARQMGLVHIDILLQ